MHARYRRRRDQSGGAQHPRTGEARQLLHNLVAGLPAGVETPQMSVVAGPPSDTHLHHRRGQPPEVRITDQLLDRATVQVISGVLAHELGHLINNDASRRRRCGLTLTAAAAALLGVTVALPGARGWLSPLTCALGLAMLALSRRLELQADSSSLRLIDVDQAAAALTWLQHDAHPHDNQPASGLRPTTGLTRPDLLSTHPNPDRRVRELRRAAKGV